MITLAQKVRDAGRSLGRFRACELADATEPMTRKAKRAAINAIPDFVARGEMRCVCRGVYEYVGREKRRTKLDVVWHLVRSHRQFSTSEIERLSGAKRGTVLEYLRCLRILGYLRKKGQQSWQLINDPGPDTPVNTAKCARLKRIRRDK